MTSHSAAKPRVRLDEREAWAFLAAGHTGILTSLRRDGFPVTLPVWYAVVDRAVYVGGPARTKKFARIRRDPRVSFLVESGRAWRELEAVQLTGRARFVDDAALLARIDAELERKYAAFRTPREAMPERVASHYEGERLVIGIEPEGRILSWNNARLAYGASA